MRKWENFTADRVTGFKCQPGKQQSIYWDGKTPGLGVRVTAAGSKSYIFETRLDSRTLRVTIGDLRTWVIGKAQAEARRIKTLTDQGIDPRLQHEQRRVENEEQRNETIRRDLTVVEVWNAYIKVRSAKWSARHLADHQNIAHLGKKAVVGRTKLSVPGALAALMPLKLTEVNSERVKTWLRNETVSRPTQAALAFRLLRAFLNWCEDTPEYRGIAGTDACQNRIAKDILPKNIPKTDCLQREQLPVWFAAVRAINNPVISVYLQTLLLIGSRRGELARLKWEDIDFQWKALTIRDKVEDKRTIPLTPYVASMLVALPHRNEWVFSSPMAASGRLQEPRIRHNQACTVAGIEGLTLHGLRRSFGTLTEWVECPVGIVAQIMGHKPSATVEKHYKVRSLDLLRMWHVKIEEWILDQAVVKLEQAPGLKVVDTARKN